MRIKLPSRDALLANHWLTWARPVLSKPEFFKLRREPVARSAAIGVFFAFMLPLAQIPAAVFFAILLRTNIPVAVAATFINTPLTFGPVYYLAYRLGEAILEAQRMTGLPEPSTAEIEVPVSYALLLGSMLIAIIAATLTYLAVTVLWKFKAYRRLKRWRAQHTNLPYEE